MIKDGLNKWNNLNKGVKASFVYILANVTMKALSIITLPLFTKLMPSGEIGVVGVYNSWYTILSEIVCLALTSGGLNLCLKTFSDKKDEYISSVCFFTIITGTSCFFIYLLNPTFWQHVLKLNSYMIIMMISGFAIMPSHAFWLTRQRYDYNYKIVGAVSIIEAIFAAIFSFAFVLYGKNNGMTNLGELRLIGNYSIQYIVSLVMLLSMLVKGKTFINTKYWSFSLKLSIPLIIHSLASQVLSQSDRIMISHIVGDSEAGVYYTIYTLASVILIFWTGINTAYVPYLYENLDDKNKHKSINGTSIMMIAGFLAIGMFLVLFSPDILRLLTTHEYLDRVGLIPPIVCGVFFIAISNIYSNFLIYYKKTNYIVIATIVAAMINLILNYIGLRKFDYSIAAYTTLISYLVMVLIEEAVIKWVYYKETKTKFFISTRYLHFIEITAVFLCLISLKIYKIDAFRYCIIIVSIIVTIINRKKLTSFIKRIIDKKL